MIEKFNEFWRDFWYQAVYNDDTPYGGTYDFKFEFRTQRLINIIIGIVILLLLYYNARN